MKVAIFGPNGMLGKALVAEAEKREHEAIPLDCKVHKYDEVKAALIASEPDVVINAAGVIALKGKSEVEMHEANVLGPYAISTACYEKRIRFVQVSTDCVFSGKKLGPHKITDAPDPIDLYGITKSTGEILPVTHDSVVVRTSFIGPDHGLLPWFIKESKEKKIVSGYGLAFWSGSSVYEVARGLLNICDTRQDLKGIQHLATTSPWSKCGVLQMLRYIFNLDVQVQMVYEPMIDRSLEPTIEMNSIGHNAVKQELWEKCKALL